MNIFSKTFDNITEEDWILLEEYFHGFDYKGSGYTFLANYIWRESYCINWEVINGYLCMAGADCMIGQRSAVMSMPLTATGEYDIPSLRATVLECKKRFEDRGIPFRIALVPEHMLHFLEEAFGDNLMIVHDRNEDEYVYEKESLITLKGRELHKKKNHLNHFLRNYSYESKKITSSMKEEVMEFVYRSLGKKFAQDPDEIKSLEMETRAIDQILTLIDRPEIYSTAIYVGGKIAGFSIGERLDENMAVVHFEKANGNMRGLYQLVAREFCLGLPEEITLVNREEDMGLPNLRQAKESLNPVGYVKKYFAYLI